MLCKVTLFRNDGTNELLVLARKTDTPLGRLPEVKRDGYVFLGWYDLPDLGSGLRYKSDTEVRPGLKLYAHWRPVKKKQASVSPNHMKSTWEDDARNQTSLEMGTPAYEEYVEDLQEHDPFRPDDEMHEDLEQYNELIAEKIREKTEKNRGHDPFEKQKVRAEMRKREMVRQEYRRLEKAVKETPTTEDDEKLKRLDVNSFIHSDGFSGERSVKVMEEAVFSR